MVEINEAFASVAMAWLKETGYDHAKTNVNGGAMRWSISLAPLAPS